MNNYERIKAMSINEMAELLLKSFKFDCGDCFSTCANNCERHKQEACRRWLHSESEG